MLEDVFQIVIEIKGFIYIIVFYYDFENKLFWKNGGWIFFYNKVLQYGDVIKFVGMVCEVFDNFDLINFKMRMLEVYKKFIIVLNMGIVGKFSRVFNGFLILVFYLVLLFKVVFGQFLVVEIR